MVESNLNATPDYITGMCQCVDCDDCLCLRVCVLCRLDEPHMKSVAARWEKWSRILCLIGQMNSKRKHTEAPYLIDNEVIKIE